MPHAIGSSQNCRTAVDCGQLHASAAVMTEPMSETSAPTGRWADLANPTRFVALADRLVPWLAGLSAVVLAAGCYLGFTAPEDYQQGTTVRIMYIHVPFAWLAMMCYTIMALAALGTLVWRHPLADVSLKAAAPIGAVFTALALITGSIWGKPMWGTWWVWDARLTSVFILFLMYLGIIALTRAIDDPARRRARPPSSRWSASSTSRSSNSRSTGGTRCTSRPRCSGSTARPSIRACCCR